MDSLELSWVGGTHPFRLRLSELRALQDARNAGPEEIFNRFRIGNWRADDLIQVIRFGLVGGGTLSASEAATLVTPLVDLHPLSDFKLTALAILGHALFGPEDDQLGEGEGALETPPENGSSLSSSGQEQ